MSLKYDLEDHYEEVFEDEDYMILYCGTHPIVSENGKLIKFSAEAGSSSQDRMHKIAEELIDSGYEVTVREQHTIYKMETDIFRLTKENLNEL